MRITSTLTFRKTLRLFMLVALLCAAGSMSLRSQASTAGTNVTITNNSAWEVRYLYLSHAENDDWGDDVLNGASIGPGGSYTLSVSWDQPTVKLIAEDQDGCFLSTTVDATAASSWTISSSSARNCGS